jgi:translation initiation factor 2B subunit (eIF-2B alpha/beta/delta family)
MTPGECRNSLGLNHAVPLLISLENAWRALRRAVSLGLNHDGTTVRILRAKVPAYSLDVRLNRDWTNRDVVKIGVAAIGDG